MCWCGAGVAPRSGNSAGGSSYCFVVVTKGE